MKKLALAAALFAAVPANAALTPFQTFNGHYGLSTDGLGMSAASGTISAFVPAGSTVTAAYLYKSTNNYSSGGTGISLNGNNLAFGPLSVNASYTALASARADVTSLVAGVVNGGAGGTYTFNVGEQNSGATDGTALVVVYENAGLTNNTVAILDGFSAVGGETTTLNFANPLDPTQLGFTAEMRLGIGFSCCDQASQVDVNGTRITNVAGNYDDGLNLANGSLITVGGNDDPYSPFLPTYENDHERYNLASYIDQGDTSITIHTLNPSGNDNIFLAAFLVTGFAGVNEAPPVETPEPAMLGLFGLGAIGLGLTRRRRR